MDESNHWVQRCIQIFWPQGDLSRSQSLHLRRRNLCIIGGSYRKECHDEDVLSGCSNPTKERFSHLARMSPSWEKASCWRYAEISPCSFKEEQLFDSLTVAENIKYPLVEHKWGTPEDKTNELKRFSSGWASRSLIKNLLSLRWCESVWLWLDPSLYNPKYFYDEPTTGLDPEYPTYQWFDPTAQRELKVTSMVVYTTRCPRYLPLQIEWRWFEINISHLLEAKKKPKTALWSGYKPLFLVVRDTEEEPWCIVSSLFSGTFVADPWERPEHIRIMLEPPKKWKDLTRKKIRHRFCDKAKRELRFNP